MGKFIVGAGFLTTGSGGAGTGWEGEVANFAALPAAAGATGKIYLVLASTGLIWNRRRGLYRSDGADWERLSNATFEVLDTEAVFSDEGDSTKKMEFELSDITTGNTRTLTCPDIDGTILLNEGAVTINESGADVDFRVEGVGQANALFVQGSNGFVGVGTNIPDRKLSVVGDSISFTRYITGANPMTYFLQKGRGTEVSPTIVADGDFIGRFRFRAYDGTDFGSYAAQIDAQIDGTPALNDMPGSLIFSTTASGDSTSTERMRIDSAGNVGIGTDSPEAPLSIVQGSAGTVAPAADTTLHLENNGDVTQQILTPTTGKFSLRFGEDGDNFRSGFNMYGSTHASYPDSVVIFSGNSGSPALTVNADKNVEIGSTAVAGTLTPTNIHLGGDYGTNAPGNPGNLKVKPFDSGSAAYGLGVSNGLMEYQVPATAEHAFYVNEVEAMRIDSAGLLGIGTGSPTLSVSGTGMEIFGGSNSGIRLRTGNDGWGYTEYADETPTVRFIQGYQDSNQVYKIIAGTSLGSNLGLLMSLTGQVSLNEAAPDTDSGGLCLNHGSSDGFVFTAKNTDIAHGMTDVNETDTYFAMKKVSNGAGGIQMRGLSEGTIAFDTRAYITTENTTTATSSTGAHYFTSSKKSGTTVTTLTSTANIAVFTNGSTAAQIFKANGDIYTNTDQTSGLAGTFDKENDIMLARAAQLGVKGHKEKHLKKHTERLQELGIMEGDYLSHRKITDLQLGATSQLFNIIKGISKKLGISEEDLFKMAKEY